MMSTTLSMLTPELLLVAAGVVILVAGSLSNRSGFCGPVCLAALLAAGACLWLGNANDAERAAGEAISAESGTASEDLSGEAIFTDGIASVGRWLNLVVGVLLALSGFRKEPRPTTESVRCGMLLLAAAGAMTACAARDLVLMVLAVELATLPVVVLLLSANDSARHPDGATNSLRMTMLSTALLLLGFGVIFGLAGTTRMDVVHQVLLASYSSENAETAVGGPSRLGLLALVLIVGGLGCRLGAVPFHFGAADLFRRTDAWTAAVAASWPKAAAFLVLLRLTTEVFVGIEQAGQIVMLVLAASTMLVGGLTALCRNTAREVLGYLTLAQTGSLLSCVAVVFWETAPAESDLSQGQGLPDGVGTALFLLGNYLVCIVGLFAVFAYLSNRERPMDDLSDLNGLVRTEPLAATSAGLFLLGLAGCPPLAGFWGRTWLLAATLSVHSEAPRSSLPIPNQGFVLLALVGLVHWFLTAAVCWRFWSPMFFQDPVSRPRPGGSHAALASALLSAVVTVGVGLLPGPVLGVLLDVAPQATRERAAGNTSVPHRIDRRLNAGEQPRSLPGAPGEADAAEW